jgi:beta-1,4-mannosyl-glycoprotein beta-1,4-N-acetylglucosaminyltransferase
MAIVDCFYFNNELDVLEIRLNILDSVVDKFVLIESSETFSGFEKPLYYKENKERFVKWNHKISHHVVECGDMDIFKQAVMSPNTASGESYWIREFYQKESAKKALSFCTDNDLVFISDVDEIWNPIIFLSEIDSSTIYKPRQKPYLYYLNQRTGEDWLGWTGTIFTYYKNIKNACINHLRTDDMTEYVVIENGGWHFNAIGGREKKQSAFKHPVYENDIEWKRREINMHKDEADLPEYILNNKEKWKQYLL